MRAVIRNKACSGSNGGWHQNDCRSGVCAARYSALPAGLTDGVDALAWTHDDNWAYAGTTTGRAR
eukprot:6676789-Prymnesium_polylepis.1